MPVRYILSSVWVKLSILPVIHHTIYRAICVFLLPIPLVMKFAGHHFIPLKRPVMRRLDVFFDVRLNKRFSKHRWFETQYHLSWHYSKVNLSGPQPALSCDSIDSVRPIFPMKLAMCKIQLGWFYFINYNVENTGFKIHVARQHMLLQKPFYQHFNYNLKMDKQLYAL